jgi:hypothetical protein
VISIRFVLASAALALVASAGPALAHGEIEGTDPAEGAKLRRAPGSVAVTFTEAPTAEAVLKVRDGCKRQVTQGVDVTDATATARVAVGQPGKWQVSYRVISALDGHETEGGFSFTVAGRKDCTPDEPESSAPPEEDETDAAPTPKGEDDTGGGAPVVPIALGTIAVVVLALVVRRSGSA